MHSGIDSQSAIRLLRIFGINPPVMLDHSLAQESSEEVIQATVDGIGDPELGRAIRLKIDKYRAARACPLTGEDAKTLVAEFHKEAILCDNTHDTTLVQLVLKCSKLYAQSGLAELHLVCYVTPQGYRTHAIYMLRSRILAPAREKDVLTNRL